MKKIIERLLGKRTIGIQCHFCSWETDIETECESCSGTGMIIFDTYHPEHFMHLKVCWIV